MKKAPAIEEAKFLEDAVAKADFERGELENFYVANLRQLARLRDNMGALFCARTCTVCPVA